MSLTHKTLSRWTCGFDFGFAVTLFGYQFGFSFDLTEWHLMAERHEGIGYLFCVGPIALDILDATQYTPPATEEELLKAEIDYVKKALEQETVRLSACSSTLAGKIGELEVTDYAFSSAQQSCYDIVLRYTQALKEIEKLRKKLGGQNVKGKSLPTGKSRRKS